MKWNLIAVVGNDRDCLEMLRKGIKEFPISKAYLLSTAENSTNAGKVAAELRKTGIAANIAETDLSSVESIFSTISQVKNSSASEEKFIINIEGDYQTSCIMLSAAFVNGVQAIGIMGDKVMAYPIMKFSYYAAVSDKKQKLLEIIAREKTVPSLEFLSREIKMSLPLVAYHVRGTREKVGLEELGLVETKRNGKTLNVSITPLGNLVSRGYLDQCRECPPAKTGKHQLKTKAQKA